MSADDPNEARWSFRVTRPITRKVATLIKEHPKKTSILLAVAGITFSLISIFFRPGVIPDIVVDLLSATIAYVYIRRVVKEEAKMGINPEVSAEESVS